MIISCNNCYKKFEINSELIPERGRLLECSSCNNQWFFKIDNKDKETKSINEINLSDLSANHIKSNNITNHKKIKTKPDKTEVMDDYKNIQSNNKNKRIGILNMIFVFIISISALIILLDTFKSPISIFIPNIEFILYNLYESTKDIILFFKDLA